MIKICKWKLSILIRSNFDSKYTISASRSRFKESLPRSGYQILERPLFVAESYVKLNHDIELWNVFDF